MLGGPAGDVIQTIWLRNVDSETWEVFDVRAASITDEVVEVTVKGNLTDYLNPKTGEVLARVAWASESFSGAPFNWSIDIDQIVWCIQ